MKHEILWQAFLWTITILSLLGTALNVRKSIWCFYLWAGVNVAWIFVDILGGLWSRMFLDFVHLVFAIWGIVSWRSDSKGNGREGASS